MATPLTPPSRGFERSEFEQRTQQLQQRMAADGVDAVFFSTEPEFRYFSGFKSQFWESPPRPEDDGISLLGDTLAEVARQHRRVGAMLGAETHLRMPAANFSALQQRLSQHEMVDVSASVREIRSVKSAAEVAKIRFACEVTAAGFDYLLQHLRAGMSEREACKAMHIEMLRLGADSCPYLISASGQGGYDNIIMGPSDRTLGEGDVLIIDTGANFDGYFSDFDRNYGFGRVEVATHGAYEAVYRSTEDCRPRADHGRRLAGDVDGVGGCGRLRQ